MAWVWGADPSSACRQWLEPDKLLGSRYWSEERQEPNQSLRAAGNFWCIRQRAARC